MDTARRRQFSHIETAKARLLEWARANAVPLTRVEFNVPFVETNHGLVVWLFYDTDSSVERLGGDGTTDAIQQMFRCLLDEDGYPHEGFALSCRRRSPLISQCRQSTQGLLVVANAVIPFANTGARTAAGCRLARLRGVPDIGRYSPLAAASPLRGLRMSNVDGHGWATANRLV